MANQSNLNSGINSDANGTNEQAKGWFVYLRSTGEKVPVTKEQHDAYYEAANRIRIKERAHDRCLCPKRFVWKCDGDCLDCEFHAAGDILSLDMPMPDGSTLGETLPDTGKRVDEVVADRLLLNELFDRMCELDPDADTIIGAWRENNGCVSDREIARRLDRPQMTFADQIKKYRSILHEDFDI